MGMSYGERSFLIFTVSALLMLTSASGQERVLQGEAARFYAQARGLPVISRNAEGGLVELRSIEDGLPIYITQNNRESAQMMGTFDLNQAQGSNPVARSLRGSGVLLGVWDGGWVLTDHPLFGPNVSLGDNAQFFDEHATHVAGTMVGQSSARAAAGGMAQAADLISYYWDNDVSEMGQAAQQRMAVSNHSYGEIRGWFYDAFTDDYIWYGDVRISTVEDYRYGFYSSRSREWDQLLFDNPYLVAVSSSGNSRNDVGPANGSHYYVDFATGSLVLSNAPRNPDGNGTGYDTISGKEVSKNGIVVGAIRGQNGANPRGMSDFSSWGPTDDGRIKPDVVAKGVSVLSSTFLIDFDQNFNLIYEPVYERWNGTSMASPGIAGSLGLLNEYWTQTYGSNERPLSATVRALVAHTAEDLPTGQNDGPDYRYGWGLLDMIKIIETIDTANSSGSQLTAGIFEETLPNGDEITYGASVEAGEELTVTLAWTDPPGRPVAARLNPRNSMLVNNLELEVLRISDGQLFYPYRLDPENPSAGARTDAANAVDNIERIDVPTSNQAEEYVVRIYHTGNLQSSAQNFSLVITGGAISGTVGSPSIVNRPSLIPEGGEVDFGVRLPFDPGQTVTVSIEIDPVGPIRLSTPDQLTFSTGNWSQPQTVTLRADLDSPPNGCSELSLIKLTRDDIPEAVTSLPVRTQDEDLEILMVTDRMVLDEGFTGPLGVRLSDSPCSETRVLINQTGGSNTVTVTPDVLVFGDSNWDQDQQILILGAEDPGDYRDESATFELRIEGRSAVRTLQVEILDTDELELVIGTNDLNVNEGSRELRELGSQLAGRRVPLNLNLPPAPGESLNILLERTAGSDPDIYIWDRVRQQVVTTTSWTVDATNWQAPQDVIFVAAEDTDRSDGQSTFRVLFQGLADPGRYQQSITLTEADTNITRPVIQDADGQLYRSSDFPDLTPGTFTVFVRLNQDPFGPVTLTAREMNASTALNVLTTSFSFDSSNWNIAQPLIVEVMADADAIEDRLTVEVTGEGLPSIFLEFNELERLTFNSPSSPILSTPPNNALIATSSITLRWDLVELADAYDVYVSNTPVPVGDAAAKYTVTQPSLELQDLQSGVTYYWRVIAKNPVGGTPSNIFRFATASNINTGLSAPIGAEPAPVDPGPEQDVPADQGTSGADEAGEQNQPPVPTTTSGNSATGFCGGPVMLALFFGLLATRPRRVR